MYSVITITVDHLKYSMELSDWREKVNLSLANLSPSKPACDTPLSFTYTQPKSVRNSVHR